MRKRSFVIFDDYVIGATTSSPVYSDTSLNEVLSAFDALDLECVVDDLNVASGDSLDIYVEHSGTHWLHKNGSADNPPSAGSGDVSWPAQPTAGYLTSAAQNVKFGGDPGTAPMLAFARLQIFFGTSSMGAHIRITATQRDGS